MTHPLAPAGTGVPGTNPLGVEVGDSEDGAFWTAFLRSLRARGLGGVQLVISDHHLGLKNAIASVWLTWTTGWRWAADAGGASGRSHGRT